jgi:carboxyl-terminal processing protease
MSFRFFRILIAVVAGICLHGATMALTSLAGTPSQAFHESNDPDELNGVWRSRGYGWLLSIGNGRTQIYDEGKDQCIIDPESDDELATLSEGLVINSAGQTIRLPLGDASYLYTFDKIDGLPEKCRTRPDSDPAAVLESFIDIFNRHYAFFSERKIDWHMMADVTRKSITTKTTNEELLDVVQNVISKFDDDHVSLVAKIGGETMTFNTGAGKTLGALALQAEREHINHHEMFKRWLKAIWSNDIGKRLLNGKGWSRANDKIRYGLIDGQIGYLSIRSMGEFLSDNSDNESGDLEAVEKAMDDAIAKFKGARAVVVDLAINDGGFDKVARRIAGRFATKRTLGYFKYAGDSKSDKPQAVYIEPSKKRRYTGPVYLITSDVTVSAAEILTLSMRALPNVTHVGEATRGSLSDQLWKPLPNGWSLSLSNEVYLDAEGKRWEGVGIPPDVPLALFSSQDVTTGYLKAVRAVIEMAKADKPRTPSRKH